MITPNTFSGGAPVSVCVPCHPTEPSAAHSRAESEHAILHVPRRCAPSGRWYAAPYPANLHQY